jgi:hypothetical protein
MPRGPKPLKTKLKANEFYCVGCRHRRVGEEISFKEVKNYKRANGKVPMLKSKCKQCGANLNKIVKNSAADKLKAKYA